MPPYAGRGVVGGRSRSLRGARRSSRASSTLALPPYAGRGVVGGHICRPYVNITGYIMCPSLYGRLGAHNIGSYVKYGQERGISVGVFCLPWDFIYLCAGAVVGGRRAPRVPLWARVPARLAPARRGQKVTRICVCVPSLCVGVGAGAGGVRPWAEPKGRSPPAPARRGCWWPWGCWWLSSLLPPAFRPPLPLSRAVGGGAGCWWSRGPMCARALLSAGGALLAFRCGRLFPAASRPRLGSNKYVPV